MSEDEGQTQTPELDRVVDEILLGQRIVLFPPGIWAFVLVNVLVVLGATVLIAALVPTFTGDSREQRVVAQLIGVVAAAATTCIPAFVILTGLPWGFSWMRRTTGLLLCASVVCLLLASGERVKGSPLAYLTVLVASAGASLLVRSQAYFAAVIFRERLRTRRAVLVRQREQGRSAD